MCAHEVDNIPQQLTHLLGQCKLNLQCQFLIFQHLLCVCSLHPILHTLLLPITASLPDVTASLTVYAVSLAGDHMLCLCQFEEHRT